jgi:hypothetical protein
MGPDHCFSYKCTFGIVQLVKKVLKILLAATAAHCSRFFFVLGNKYINADRPLRKIPSSIDMKFSIATVFAATLGLVELVSAYPITHATSLHCRSSPSASAKLVKTYKAGTDIKISCQTEGQSIEGSTIWDKTQDGCYVADYYVKVNSHSS